MLKNKEYSCSATFRCCIYHANKCYNANNSTVSMSTFMSTINFMFQLSTIFLKPQCLVASSKNEGFSPRCSNIPTPTPYAWLHRSPYNNVRPLSEELQLPQVKSSYTVKTCLRRPLKKKKRPNFAFQDRLSLNADQL